MILDVHNLGFSLADGNTLKNITFTVNKGDKIAVISKNGLAVSALFRILADKDKADKGEMKYGVTITKSYVPNDNSEYFQDSELNLVDWLRQYSTEKDESFIRGFLGKMLFSGSEALKQSNVLSGGEKVRCMLSKTMLSGANVLLLDGPTAHLDLESITSVNEGVKKFKGTVIMTCHDHEFIQTTANRIMEITDGKISDDSYDTYEDYMAKKKKQASLH